MLVSKQAGSYNGRFIYSVIGIHLGYNYAQITNERAHSR